MARLLSAVCALAMTSSFVTPARARRLTVSTTPDQIVLGSSKKARITLHGSPFEGEVKAATNVGSVKRLWQAEKRLDIDLRLPAKTFPQVVCLLLWQRGDDRVMVLRVPLFGRTFIPIDTRPNASVVLKVAKRHFGPVKSDAKGKASIQILVPPGVTSGKAVVEDSHGLKSSRIFRIRRPRYNQLAFAVTSKRRRAYHLTVASAERVSGHPKLVVSRQGRQPIALQLKQRGVGRWDLDWKVPKGLAGETKLRVTLAGSRKVKKVAIPAAKPPKPPVVAVVKRPPPKPVEKPMGRSWSLAASGGLLHSLSGYASARIAVAFGVRQAFSSGIFGLELELAFAWASQQSTGAPSLLVTQHRLLMVPLSLFVTYRPPVSWRLLPYLAAGAKMLLATAWSEGALSADVHRVDARVGPSVRAGAGYRIGPGRAFFELGYSFAELDEVDVSLPPSALTIAAGYRFVF
jgi:hypothetical protein